MKRGGLPVIRSTARARRLPSCSSSMIRVRRDVTRPYSAATKNAFSSTSPSRASSSQQEGHGRSRPTGARVLGGRSSSTRISQPSIARHWTDRTSVRIIAGCGSPTAKSRARSRSTESRECPSSGRSTPTWAASTAAPSATSAASSGAPTGPPTTATAPRSGSSRTSPRCCGASCSARARGTTAW